MLTPIDEDQILARKMDLAVRQTLDAVATLPSRGALQGGAGTAKVTTNWQYDSEGNVVDVLRCDDQPMDQAGLGP